MLRFTVLVTLVPLFGLFLQGPRLVDATNSEENALFSLGEDECSMMVCRAGRECKVGVDGEATCTCMASCPDHFVPVCGSNNVSYDNYCLMHRDACLTGIHISLKKKGYCSNKTIKKNKKKIQKSNSDDTNNIFEPVVCFQWERDALRRQIISHFRHHVVDQSWYRPGLKHIEKLWARFFMCDTSKDDYVDANELAACAAEVSFNLRTTDANNELVKVLCIDAIIDSGDKDSDWRLDFDEYKALMESNFKPKEKLCSLEGKKYEDGSQTKVDCNDCVCACGSWVCSSKKCDQKLNEIDELDDEEDLEDLEEEAENVKDDQVKILKIEEDIDLKIDDPDEDQPAKIPSSDDDEDDDEDDDDEDDDEDDDIDEIDIKPKKNKKL